MIRLERGDVVLIDFPFVAEGHMQRKRRPAVIIQADRYNQRRAAVIIVAITTTRSHQRLPSKVFVPQDSLGGKRGGLRLDSIVDCQTLATIPKEEIVRKLGRFPPDLMRRIDAGLQDALGLPATS